MKYETVENTTKIKTKAKKREKRADFLMKSALFRKKDRKVGKKLILEKIVVFTYFLLFVGLFFE